MNADGYSLSYLPDSDVDEALDARLRVLLSTCFTGPEDHVFALRRYFHEMPRHRWLLHSAAGDLVGHCALHDKILRCGEREFACGGVAEVCVLPEHRLQGLLKRMMNAIDAFLRGREVPFAVLFGRERNYRSSGYKSIDNLWHRDPKGGEEWLHGRNAMVLELSGQWPAEPVYLPGPPF